MNFPDGSYFEGYTRGQVPQGSCVVESPGEQIVVFIEMKSCERDRNNTVIVFDLSN